MTFDPFLLTASDYNSPDQEVLVMKACLVCIIQNEGKAFELNCQRDSNNEVIQIFDLEGNALPLNQRNRCVIWNAEVWYY